MSSAEFVFLLLVYLNILCKKKKKKRNEANLFEIT